MPTIDENRLKGNFGASYVTSLLSSECLVRPVAVDTDVGVDLYCETIEASNPFIHFWVQVKAGQQCHVLDNGDSATCSFHKDHLEYWYRQPVPVYAALVPVDWPVISDPAVYIVDITDQLIEGIPLSGETVSLRSKYKWLPGQRDSVRYFLRSIVPISTARAQCRLGIVNKQLTHHKNYELSFPVMPVTRFKDDIINQIRWTAAFSIIFMHDYKQLGDSHSSFRKRLAQILEQYDDDPHWENYYARAISQHIDGNYDAAICLYQRAIDSIQGDPEINIDIAPWKSTLLDIFAHKQSAQNHEPIQD